MVLHCRRCSAKDASRRGITLLEVLIATSIFTFSLVAILNLMGLGHDSRLSARLDAESALRCESVMGEYISGMRDLVAESDAQFDDDETGNWYFSTIVDEGPGESLLKVTVEVEHRISDSESNSYFLLTRYVRDPQLFIDAALDAGTSDE